VVLDKQLPDKQKAKLQLQQDKMQYAQDLAAALSSTRLMKPRLQLPDGLLLCTPRLGWQARLDKGVVMYLHSACALATALF